MAHAMGGGYPTGGVVGASCPPDMAKDPPGMPREGHLGPDRGRRPHCVPLSVLQRARVDQQGSALARSPGGLALGVPRVETPLFGSRRF
jgi:hypothetical protein